MIIEDYVDNGDGTVTHKKTCLMWKRCSEGQTWEYDRCVGKISTFKWGKIMPKGKQRQWAAFAGHDDWRVPSAEELQSIIDRTRVEPSINSYAFPNTPSEWFWSSSAYAGGSSYSWIVDFGYGYVFSDARTIANAVRLVRGGQ